MHDFVEYERQLAEQEKTEIVLTDIEPPDIVADYLKKQKKNNSQCKKGPARVYCFCGSSYIDNKELVKYIQSVHWIEHWSATYHDKDIYTLEDEKENANHKANTLKPPHTHLLIKTYNGHTAKSIKWHFDRFSKELYKSRDEPPQNTLMQACNNAFIMYRYQLHLDDDDKYPYEAHLRMVDDVKYWQKFEKSDGDISNKNRSLTIVNMMLSGVPYYRLLEIYGRDFVIYYRTYKEMVSDILSQQRLGYGNLGMLQNVYKRCLLNSDYTDKEQQQFFTVLAYIQQQLLYEYADADYYLKEHLK